MAQRQKLDPESLVARIIAELQENPEAQRMLLHALLTNEFLGMPARLDRIEKDIAELKVDVRALKTDVAELKTDVAELKTDVAELKTDVAELKTDVAELKTDVAELKTTTNKLVNDVGELKGHTLELRVHSKIRSLICQSLNLRRPQIRQSAVQLSPTTTDFDDAIGQAAEDGRIGEGQEDRIVAADLILRAQRRRERTPVWVAVEVSYRVDAHDIDRSREAADALATVFGEAAMAVVAGCQIDPTDRKRAADADVRYVELPT